VRIGLRWRILSLVLLTPLVLALAVMFTVHRNVKQHVNSSSIHESLEHSVAVFESMLTTRSRALAGGGRVVVQDPRFFSLLMLASSQRDSRFTATVKGMASDFNRITQTEVFEVLDRQGRLLASVGPATTARPAREALVGAALTGRGAEGLLVQGRACYQAAATPVFADGRVIGVLLLGARVGEELARELKSEMHCEVTFLNGSTVTGTTLQRTADLAALERTLSGIDPVATPDLKSLGVLRVRASGSVYLTLVRRIPGAAPDGSQLYVMQRSFDPESAFQGQMRHDLLELGVLALLMALITGWLLSNQIVGPLNALVRGARAMEAGDYAHPLRVWHHDEIGYLVERFVAMRKREEAYVASLEQTTRLKSEFLSFASSELRTPISALAGYRELLSSETFGPVTAQQRQALAAMHESIMRLTGVAEEATRMAQLRGERLRLNLQRCELEPLVQTGVGTAIAQGRQRPVRVDLACQNFATPVEADENALGHAVAHLVTNAIRFTPDGGEVDVRVLTHGDRVRVEVRDHGTGIAPGRLEELLTRSAPTGTSLHHETSAGLEYRSTGLGLGLPVTVAIVEAHGGKLTAKSREGEGSTFVIELPIAAESSNAAAA